MVRLLMQIIVQFSELVLVRMFFGVFAPRPRPAARGDAHMPRGSSREAIGVAVAGTLHGAPSP